MEEKATIETCSVCRVECGEGAFGAPATTASDGRVRCFNCEVARRLGRAAPHLLAILRSITRSTVVHGCVFGRPVKEPLLPPVLQERALALIAECEMTAVREMTAEESHAN